MFYQKPNKPSLRSESISAKHMTNASPVSYRQNSSPLQKCHDGARLDQLAQALLSDRPAQSAAQPVIANINKREKKIWELPNPGDIG
jgi:hypothetical protein